MTGAKAGCLIALASALLACGPPPTATAGARPRTERSALARVAAETSRPTPPPPGGEAPKPSGPSPSADLRGPSEELFVERGRCRAFWVEGYPAQWTVSAQVAEIRRTSKRERTVRLRDAADTEHELRFDCEPGDGPPVTPGMDVRADLECSTGGWAPSCRGLLATKTGTALLITRYADLARYGFEVRDGPVVTDRSYLSRGRERVFALRVRSHGAEVVTEPYGWVTLSRPEERFHVFGWASRWSGVRPPDAEDFSMVVVARALGAP